MILKSLYLKSFGKFQEYRLDLKEGLNVIYGPNESGKTTIQRFIKGIFFGFFKSNVKRRVYDKEKELYEPWHANSFKGYIVVHSNNTDYRIERDFTKKQEKVSLVDLETGEECTEKCDYDMRSKLPLPLSHISDLDEGTYTNILSASQLTLKPDESFSQQLRDHYQELTKGKEYPKGLNSVFKEIEERKKQLGSEKRRSSPIGQLTSQIDQKRISLQHSDERYHQIRTIDEQLSLHQRQLNELEKRMQQVSLDANNRQKARYEERALKKNAMEKELITLKHEKQYYGAYEDLDEEIIEKAYAFFTKANQQKKGKKKKGKTFYLSFVLYLLLLIGGLIISVVFNGLAGLALSLLSLIGMITTIVVDRLKKNKNHLELKALEEERKMLPLYIKTYDDYIKAKSGKEHNNRINKEIREKSQWLQMMEEDKPDQTGEYVDYGNLDEKQELVDSIARLEERKKSLAEQSGDIKILEQERLTFEEERQRLYDELNALEKVEHVLLKMTENDEADFQKLLQEELGEVVSQLTGGKYVQFKVNKDFSIVLYDKKEDVFVSIEQVSAGTKDAIHIALRLAMLKHTKTLGPLILDDSFVQMDDKRLERMLVILNKISTQRQVLLFTCQKRECEIMDKNSYKYNKIQI